MAAELRLGLVLVRREGVVEGRLEDVVGEGEVEEEEDVVVVVADDVEIIRDGLEFILRRLGEKVRNTP